MALFPVPSSQSSLLQIGALFSACFSSLPLFPTIQLAELTIDHYSPRKHTLWMWRLPSPAWPSHCFLHCKSWCNGLQVSALKNARSGPPCSLAAAGLLLFPVNALLFVLVLQSPPFTLSLPNHVSQYPSPTSSAYFFSLSLSVSCSHTACFSGFSTRPGMEAEHRAGHGNHCALNYPVRMLRVEN